MVLSTPFFVAFFFCPTLSIQSGIESLTFTCIWASQTFRVQCTVEFVAFLWYSVSQLLIFQEKVNSLGNMLQGQALIQVYKLQR